MKNLILTVALTLICANSANADSTLQEQTNQLLKDKQEYIDNKCIINSVNLWFVHTCKDVARTAGIILNDKGYRFTAARVEIDLGGPMQSEVVGAKITSSENPSLVADFQPRDLVGKVVAHNITDKAGVKYLVLSLVSPSMDLVTVSTTRIGKQGKTNDMFCQNSYVAARKYLEDLKKLSTCKAVTEQNDL